jgi:hypothetical protein
MTDKLRVRKTEFPPRIFTNQWKENTGEEFSKLNGGV